MNREELNINSRNGNSLSCIIAYPDHPVEATIVVSHGYKAQKDESAFELVNLGYDVVIFDYQGCGDSEGHLKDKTATRDIEDLKSIIDFIDIEQKIIIYGASFGAFTALNLAMKDGRIDALVLKSPITDFQTIYSTLDLEEELNRGFHEDGIQYMIYNKDDLLSIPIRIVHGNADTTVPVEESRRLGYLLPDVELRLIEYADHQYRKREDELRAVLREFFEELRCQEQYT
jgi:alpha-beta hydrolase superfamily lysophospholipase